MCSHSVCYCCVCLLCQVRWAKLRGTPGSPPDKLADAEKEVSRQCLSGRAPGVAAPLSVLGASSVLAFARAFARCMTTYFLTGPVKGGLGGKDAAGLTSTWWQHWFQHHYVA